jgi:flagellum-specific peptidoglycan hydrolase FlgJ
MMATQGLPTVAYSGGAHVPTMSSRGGERIYAPMNKELALELPVVEEKLVTDHEPAVEPEIVAQSARTPSSPQEAFIFSLASGAQESQRVTGVPASVTIAQGILESSWGKSKLSREGHNYFGIKALSKEGPAGVVWMQTWEVENGENIMVEAPFRRYNNAAESLIDHGYFFVENRRYAGALQAKGDAQEFARRINAAGYATDPAYAPKLISIMDQWDLYQYDVHTA